MAKVRCELEVLSPLHIGNGNEFTLIDFVINNKNFIKVNFDKLAGYCFENKIPLAEEIEEKKENFKMEDFFKKHKLESKNFSDYSIPVNIDLNRMRRTKPKIKEFIKSANKSPYIPGSSIKGAVRTALLWSALTNSDINKHCDNMLNMKKVKRKEACKKLEEQIFGEDAHKDILRALRISDIDAIPIKNNLEVNEIKIIGNPSSIPTYVENLKEGTKTNFDFWMDKRLLNEEDFESNKLKNCMNIGNIAKICREFSLEFVKKQLKYKQYDNKTEKFYKDLYEKIHNLKEDKTILNIGWGGGWYSKTIGLKVENYPKFSADPRNFNRFKRTLRSKLNLGKNPRSKSFVLNFPKTRRVTISNIPLGWVKVRL
jgi:CRISPR-associated protein Csm5